MSRRPFSFGIMLTAVVCAAPLFTPPLAHADTCSGLQLSTLTPATVGTTPNAVAVGDFNRDGRMDVATVNSGSNDVSILLGDGNGGFTAGPNSPVALGAANPVDIAAGDLDQDGILDLVVAFGSTLQAQVLKGEPSLPNPLGAPGSFDNTSAPFALNALPTRIFLGQFTNADSDLDLVVLAEPARRLLLYGGASGITFNPVALKNLDLTQFPFSPPMGEQPSGAAPLDFNRDGRLDLAVVMRDQNKLWVLSGNGAGDLVPVTSTGTGAGPGDVAAGDVNRDGWPDLVTANGPASTASVLLNGTGTSLIPQTAVTVGGTPTRVALADLNHDGVLDLAAVDDSSTPRVASFQGLKTGPAWYDPTAYAVTLPLGSGPRGLKVADLKADGRADLVTAFSGPRQAVAIENQSGMPCARSSFAGAPRSYPAGDRPVSSAAADFNSDGRRDLVVATGTDRFIRILGNVNGNFSIGTQIGPLNPAPRAVATADMDVDGDMDVVVAQGDGTSGQVQVYLGNGSGGLVAGASQPAGVNTSALVIGDFNGDGAPDVAAASEDTGQVFRFLGNGMGGLGAGAALTVGAAPRALVAADFNGDLKLDLAVANFLSNSVSIFGGNGDGTFTGGPVLAVGANPQGIAAADLNGDLRIDVVTADFGSGQVSVNLQNGVGGFLPAVPYAVGTNPTAVALLDLQNGDAKPEIAVTTAGMSGAQSLTVLTNNGSGAFPTPGTDHPVRNAPQAITPIDADNDGLVDLAIPCSSADAVVVLINRPAAPFVFSRAPHSGVHDRPHGAVSGDFDGDGDLDLAVANSASGSLSLMNGDGLGGLAEYATFPVAGAEAIAAGDFNQDGKLDLAVSAPSEAPPAIAVFLGAAGGAFAPQPLVSVGFGAVPDDLVAGDFDGDGDLDLAVCDTGAGSLVMILRNSAGSFSLVSSIGAGNRPTAIATADFDGDGDLDLAVAYDDSNNVQILDNQGPGFASIHILALAGGDTSPVSVTAADFDGDGKIDVAAAAIDNDRVHVYRNLGTLFATPGTFAVPYVVRFVTAADVNLDGRPDLVTLGAGVSVLRGLGGMSFEPPETVVARYSPIAAVVRDFNRDGRPDIAVVNEDSDDVTMLASSACSQQHIEVSLQPTACGIGSPPYFFDAAVKAFDDGANTATCAAGVVSPSIVPGTGDPTAILGGPASLTFTAGVASFSGANGLSLDKSGRYRLQFQAAGIPAVQTRNFTLVQGGTVQILGPNSVCPGSPGVYSTNRTFDTYTWTLTPPGPPTPVYTPTATLSTPPLSGSYTLNLLGRDECVTGVNRNIFFGDLASVTLQINGASSVCVDCIGGSAKAVELGGGTPVSRQWGYRTVSGSGPITNIAGEGGEIYVLKGASFPGPGTYFVVVTSTPSCGVPTVSNEWTVSVVASVPNGEVRNLAASSRGSAAGGQNQLRWVNTTGVAEEIRIRWDEAPVGTSDCISPPNVGAPFDGEAVIGAPVPSMRDGFLHAGPTPPVLLDTAYCYSVFVKVSGVYSPGRTVKARPFDSNAGPVKWSYATGGSAVVAPTVSGPAILAMSNDRTVHALTRGSTGGDWPATWVPTELTGVAHSRSPVVPFQTPLNGADTVLFAADDASPGFLHAIDVRTGNRPWPAQSQSLSMTGAPGGMFVQFLGVRDALFIGTRDSSVNNALRAVDVANGTLIEAYAPGAFPGPIGPINGSPAIDYGTRRIYFASHQRLGGDTLFCLEINPNPPLLPVFTYKWSRNLGDITGSPVLRGGRVYVGNDAGIVYSIEAMNGLVGDDHSYAPLDGPVKGFLFPDRRNDDLIFATDTKVWSVSDDAATMTLNWSFTQAGFNPSMVLFRPQTNFVYVGSRNGELYELDFTNANTSTPPTSKVQILGFGQGQVGAPSLDIGVMPRLLLVGSESGVVYAVEVPFP